MRSPRIVVVGASSGGIEALRVLVASLPHDFGAPVCIVVHTSPASPGLLPAILAAAGVVPTATAATGMKLQSGRIYVAPPDHHLLVEPRGLCLGRGPKENRFRPAIDPLFRSAAQVYGPAAIGVILSGNLDDGSAGLLMIKQLGGVTIVQDPRDAVFSAMPRNALRHVSPDYVRPLADIAPLLTDLILRDVDAFTIRSDRATAIEVAIAKEDSAVDRDVTAIADPSVFACPDCHGVLLQLKDQGILRFRCHTGHAYSPESLLTALDEGVENALWSAVRAVEEVRLLLEQLTHHAAAFDGVEEARLQAQRAAVTEQLNALRLLVATRRTVVAIEGSK